MRDDEYWIEVHYDNGKVKTFRGGLNYTYEIYGTLSRNRNGRKIREPKVQRLIAGRGDRKTLDKNLMSNVVT